MRPITDNSQLRSGTDVTSLKNLRGAPLQVRNLEQGCLLDDALKLLYLNFSLTSELQKEASED